MTAGVSHRPAPSIPVARITFRARRVSSPAAEVAGISQRPPSRFHARAPTLTPFRTGSASTRRYQAR